MIFHSGGSLVWKKAGFAEQVSCAQDCGAVGWRRFLCAGKLAAGSGLSGGLCGTGGPGKGLWAGGGSPADETETGGKDMDKTKREVSRFEWDERTAPRLTRNEELICRDCRHRSEKSGICGKYPQGKPGSVFGSQRWCGEYSPESE